MIVLSKNLFYVAKKTLKCAFYLHSIVYFEISVSKRGAPFLSFFFAIGLKQCQHFLIGCKRCQPTYIVFKITYWFFLVSIIKCWVEKIWQVCNLIFDIGDCCSRVYTFSSFTKINIIWQNFNIGPCTFVEKFPCFVEIE